MPTRANALAIMAKAPIAGTVKTRLAPPLTHDQAAQFYRALLLDQLEHLNALTIADLYLVFTPDSAAPLIEKLAPAGFHCFPQGGGDLGERMNGVFTELWDRGHRNVVLIGSDLPPLPLRFLENAFELLEPSSNRVVLGPSRDGGYYLVGMNQPIPEIFRNMTWSHDQVLTQTKMRLFDIGIEPKLLPTWFDLDTTEDLSKLQSMSDLATRNAMKKTLTFLRGLEVLERPVRGDS
jgi:rSAM/selenodomain-associated transferase 1